VSLQDRLREADRRLVPVAAARLRAVLDAASGGRRSALARVARPGPLRRLDDRFARRGPLALLAEVPQLGLLLVALLLLAGGGTVLARGGEDAAAERPAPAAVLPGPPVLGPEIGAQITQYVSTARAAAAQASQERPQEEQLALVSLTAYATPEKAREVLTGLDVRRAYLRVPAGPDPTEVLSTDVEDLVGDVRRLYTATAARKGREQQEFLGLARSITPDSPEQQRFRAFYEASARASGKEATAYRTGCACLFAVVVRAPVRVLAELPALAGVRAVELAPPGATVEEIRVRPLVPEQTTVVAALPRASVTGG
jgi:hypothetical protein